MNWDKIKEGWDHYKKRAVGEWPHLTEMDLAPTAGDRTQLIELLQEKYDMSQDEATQAADDWAESVTTD